MNIEDKIELYLSEKEIFLNYPKQNKKKHLKK